MIKNIKLFSQYEKIFNESISPNTRENFWDKQAESLIWFKKYEKVLETSNKPKYQWFKNGQINMSYNILDRHVIINNKPDTKALIWETAYEKHDTKQVSYTYKEMMDEVCRLSKVMIDKFNIIKGDTVIIYMPNIPEAIFSMLACARLGAVHCVIFGGFAAEEVSDRIKDCNPKLIISASAGIEPKKKIPYYPIIKKSLELSGHLNIPILLHQREGFYIEENIYKNDNTFIYRDELEKVINYDVKSEILNSSDPLYILYTSGTTGSPKGIVRDTGGTCVALDYTMKNIMEIDHGDVFFCTSDIGWVMGHSFICYGPLLRGATTVLFEGKPVGTPHCGKLWELCEKHKVKGLMTSPTALRAIKREDPDTKIMKTYDLAKITEIHLAGEKFDTNTFEWVENGLCGSGTEKREILINDNWWQTETGWPISSSYSKRIETIAHRPGAVGKPAPGYEIVIMDNESDILVEKHSTLGKIYVKLPMPPSFMTGLWGNETAFVDKYISKCGEYYVTGDAGFFDENGYLHVGARIDDVINVAGHRLSTGRIEEVLSKVPGVAEVAVVGIKDELKGEVPLAFIICNSNLDTTNVKICHDIKENAKRYVIEHIGSISKLKDVIILIKLPKTRSGKILRMVMRKIVNKEPFKIPSTIEDSAVVDDIIKQLKEEKFI